MYIMPPNHPFTCMYPQTVQTYIDAGNHPDDAKDSSRVSSPLVGVGVGVGIKVGSESSSGSGFALADERQCLLHCLELFMSGPILVLGSGWEVGSGHAWSCVCFRGRFGFGLGLR